MPRGGFRHRREFTADELKLIADTQIPVYKLCKLVNASEPTVTKVREALGVTTIRGARAGVIKTARESRACANKNCENQFEVLVTSKKRFCSISCQLKVNNNAPKGKGSRPLRNLNTPEYKRYSRTVHGLSQEVYNKNIDIINPNRHPRTLCGVKDGWQLDHIKPIKECFEQGLSPQEASDISNLRMLPWKENLMRQFK